MTLTVLAVILSTQFSFGRMFASVLVMLQDASSNGLGFIRGWIDARRKQRARRDLVARQVKKGATSAPKLPSPVEDEKSAPRTIRPSRADSAEESAPPDRPAPPVVARKKPEAPPLPALRQPCTVPTFSAP